MNALLGQAPFLFARPSGQDVNVREACRRDIAGLYLESYEAVQKARTFKAAVVQSEAAMRKAAQEAAAAAKLKADEARKKAFDVDLAVSRDQAETKARALGEQLDEFQRQIAEAESDAKRLAVEETALADEIRKVFLIQRIGDLRDGGYPITIDYRSACPKYRFLCPLPPSDRTALLQLKLPGGLPEACRRYGGLSAIPLP